MRQPCWYKELFLLVFFSYSKLPFSPVYQSHWHAYQSFRAIKNFLWKTNHLQTILFRFERNPFCPRYFVSFIFASVGERHPRHTRLLQMLKCPNVVFVRGRLHPDSKVSEVHANQSNVKSNSYQINLFLVCFVWRKRVKI